MKKRLLSLALCLVLVVGLFSGLTVNASAGRIDDLKKEIAEKLIKEKIEQFKEEFEIPDLDMDAILSSFGTAATSGDFGVNNCLHWEVSTGVLSGKTLTISGTGAMPDFNFPEGNLAPWWNYEALGMLTSFGNFKLEGELKKVVIKDGVTNVSNYALFFLPAATQVTLPDSVTRIGRYGIALCSKLTGMSIPKGVTEIGDFGLAGDGLTAITLPDGLQTLGRGAFDACASLSGMTLPAAITAVPDKCFNDCTKLLTVDYKGEVTAIGERAFEGCKSLTKAPIPAAVTALGNSAFNGCVALTDVTLPAGVTAVPDACFQGCTALKDMKLPGTVTSVGHNAFTGCKALKDVRCYGAPPTVQPGGAAEHSFEPAIVTIHYNPDPVYGWTFGADGKWQGYTVSSKGACLHTGYGTTETTVPATCGADGRIDTVCANCGEVIAIKVIPATGAHTWDNGTVTTEPTETTPGVRTFTCAVCSQTKTEVIPATGAHTFVFTKNVAPSCTEAGYDLYTCRDCGATEQRNSKPALGHKWDSGTVTTEPTEKDPGTMTYTCTVCGATKTEVIPATGPHTHVWDEGTVTVAPTETTPGVRTYTCTVCGKTRTEIIPATGSAVCPGGAECPSFRFRDVPAPSNWAHEGIDYCVRHGLMSGFDATTFSPDTVSTRAQIVMILYNLSGDTTDYSKYYVPFTDVRPSTWYYNAVAWGYDKDIVAGMTPTTFAPDGLITREQMAVLLYGYTEKYAPAYLGGAASLNSFPDAASVSNWAYAAMSWAVGNGLISGIASNGADYLAPSGGATRAQIAAIMMRYCRLTGL
ncbi:MAG: leucine-rich repeat protein [Firmicutes bacterium]|nr:leucine-rich repeat protein [Bacillota bacterium]